MDSRFDHHQHEAKIYELWQNKKAFKPQKSPSNQSKSFTIVLPPPNANDALHVGHAMYTVEDVMVRYHRMLGDDTLWLPGTDHAGIETQFVFEKKLKKQGQSRFNFDRETLYKMIWDYVQENSDIATNQLKKLGFSLDWDRFVFMLDPDNVDIVLDTFFKLDKEGLVYRDQQLVNYCTHCGTAFSNLEILYEEKKAPFYYMKYGPFSIGTVRPETKFRDTALAVNPKDKRFKKYIGQSFNILGLLGMTKMTVVPDEEVDPEFGTGIMKVTPAHDPHDFELGKKHNLAVTPIIDFEGRMDFTWFLENPANDPDSATNQDLIPEEKALKEKYWKRAQKYHGLKVVNMRKEMKTDLEEDALLEKYDPNYTTRIAVCYKCKNNIEPLPLPQFFIKVKSLVEPVLKDMKAKKFRVHGPGYDKILKHWLENLYDWNISRQIVWGIRQPVWYDTSLSENKNILVSFINKKGEKITQTLAQTTYPLSEIKAGLQELTAPLEAKFEISKTQPGKDYIQETDTFDTWFSSSQWPFSTLQTLDRRSSKSGNNTDQSPDKDEPSNFERFYPTQVLETAYDILAFWVMRMLFMGKFATGKLPFTDIYLHGLIRDPQGQKMSKSKGNVINPLEIVDEFGADALRMALVIRSSAGLDKSVGKPDFKAMRNFGNKIWNATRYVVENDTNNPGDKQTDQAFQKRLDKIVKDTTRQLNDFKIGMAAETIYNEFWHWFCDQCIEDNKSGKLSSQALTAGLATFLKLLHPFVPFVTEAAWGEIREKYPEVATNKLLILASWPSI